jgi:hypothetical protein
VQVYIFVGILPSPFGASVVVAVVVVVVVGGGGGGGGGVIGRNSVVSINSILAGSNPGGREIFRTHPDRS